MFVILKIEINIMLLFHFLNCYNYSSIGWVKIITNVNNFNGNKDKKILEHDTKNKFKVLSAYFMTILCNASCSESFKVVHVVCVILKARLCGCFFFTEVAVTGWSYLDILIDIGHATTWDRFEASVTMNMLHIERDCELDDVIIST